MKKSSYACLSFSLVVLFCMYHQVAATSLIYNMKIRRVFRTNDAVTIAKVLGKESASIWLASGVPIFAQRNRHIVDQAKEIDVCQKSTAGGVIFNMRHVSEKAWWAEITTAVEREQSHERGTVVRDCARTGMDDIVMAAGYNFFPSQTTQVVLYGIGGVPTRLALNAYEQFDTLVGTRFFSVGGGMELSNSFISGLKQSLTAIAQVRCIHFFNRYWHPVLPRGSKIQPGNVTDFLLSMQYRKKRTVFEIGYNVTFFNNQAVLLSSGPVKSDMFLRQSGYFSIAHLCKKVRIFDKALLVGAGCAFSRAQKFDTQSASCWANVSVIF